jgi:DNA-binding MurR/RpiR family transcriptional regulator
MREVAKTEARPPKSGPPANLDHLKNDISSGRIVLNGRYKELTRYALEHADFVAFSNSHEIAAVLAINPSTVSRCARALGFDSFAKFRAIFQAFVRERKAMRGPARDARFPGNLSARSPHKTQAPAR